MIKFVKKYIIHFVVIVSLCLFAIGGPYFSFQLNEFLKSNNIIYGK